MRILTVDIPSSNGALPAGQTQQEPSVVTALGISDMGLVQILALSIVNSGT